MTIVVLNYMFSNGEYFALPLFAVVLAMPTRVFGVGRPHARGDGGADDPALR